MRLLAVCPWVIRGYDDRAVSRVVFERRPVVRFPMDDNDIRLIVMHPRILVIYFRFMVGWVSTFAQDGCFIGVFPF